MVSLQYRTMAGLLEESATRWNTTLKRDRVIKQLERAAADGDTTISSKETIENINKIT